ncbi:hypothetical protein MSUIS_05170 [Mycoplasma suis KI3806]|uniref:Uncharacterized protein n=1 Tax=Mycoplasma suis (strain KI_3806) TaxID=708248 RepID=F0V1S9_MYCS3|nr:hypothetical protein [Mycoplasma suis]CBZ40610.1 hypothetical protein MSUIS_05170 [Mycoplasma suis KI3806]
MLIGSLKVSLSALGIIASVGSAGYGIKTLVKYGQGLELEGQQAGQNEVSSAGISQASEDEGTSETVVAEHLSKQGDKKVCKKYIQKGNELQASPEEVEICGQWVFEKGENVDGEWVKVIKEKMDSTLEKFGMMFGDESEFTADSWTVSKDGKTYVCGVELVNGESDKLQVSCTPKNDQASISTVSS